MTARRTGLACAAASTLDLGEKLTGEVSAGWIREDFDDERLETDFGPDARRRPRLVAGARHDRRPVRIDHPSKAPRRAGESGSILYSGR